MRALLEQETNRAIGALDSSWDLIDILGLDNGLEVVLENLGEVVLQFGATEMLENLFPVWRVVVAAEVGLQLAAQNLQGSTLSDTVGTDQTKHLTGPGHGKPVQLEAVCRITVRDLSLEIGGQIDDVDGVKGTFLRANTASDAEALRDEGDLGLWCDFDTELARTDDGTRLLALLPTFLARKSQIPCRVSRQLECKVPLVCTDENWY